MARVEGKVALVTGGNSGLGEATVRRLAEEGAKVVFTGRDLAKGQRVEREMPGETLFLEQDVRDELRWIEVVASTVSRFGRLDILVNNAGLVRASPLETCELEEFRLHQQIMVEGPFLGCKHAVPAIAKSGGGSIINVSSIGAIKCAGEMSAYAAAKAGVDALTRCVALYCQDRKYGIRVNSIAPGGFETPLTQAQIALMDPNDPLLDQIKSLGMGDPRDFAHFALFLASDEAKHITGTTMYIDNGETAH
jgi:3(or 17)beta-hydroxysteroid dehydrogenase